MLLLCKAAAREELRQRLGLTGWGDKPLVGVVSRLTAQKGARSTRAQMTLMDATLCTPAHQACSSARLHILTAWQLHPSAAQEVSSDALRLLRPVLVTDKDRFPALLITSDVSGPGAGIALVKHTAWRTLDRGGQFVLLGSAPDPKVQVTPSAWVPRLPSKTVTYTKPRQLLPLPQALMLP